MTVSRRGVKNAAVIRPLEVWCDGGGKAVIKTPKNQHAMCKTCGRILSVVDGKIRAHRNIQEKNRYAISEG